MEFDGNEKVSKCAEDLVHFADLETKVVVKILLGLLNNQKKCYLLLVFEINWGIEVRDVFLGNFDDEIVLASVAHLAQVNYTLWGPLIEVSATTAASSTSTTTASSKATSKATTTTTATSSSASSETHFC